MRAFVRSCARARVRACVVWSGMVGWRRVWSARRVWLTRLLDRPGDGKRESRGARDDMHLHQHHPHPGPRSPSALYMQVLIAFHSTDFPLKKVQEYAALREPLVLNDLKKQEMLFDRRLVYGTLEAVRVPGTTPTPAPQQHCPQRPPVPSSAVH